MSPRCDVTAGLFLVLVLVVAGQSDQPLSAQALRAPQATFVGEGASAQLQAWPNRVLITNDDGIDAPGLAALVRAFSLITEVVVVAPTGNRSGSTHYSSIVSRPVEVEKRSVVGARAAYAVDGYPADCVLIALRGLLVDEPPDLVISGINAGANTGDFWYVSGTLGAARMAALEGIPAIAVSGGAPDALAALADWVAQLSHTAVVRDLRPPSYLTIDAPDVALAEIEGVSVVTRARGVVRLGVRRSEESSADRDVWRRASIERRPGPPGTDVDALAGGRIAVTTMQADEQDLALLRQLRERVDELPAWEP